MQDDKKPNVAEYFMLLWTAAKCNARLGFVKFYPVKSHHKVILVSTWSKQPLSSLFIQIWVTGVFLSTLYLLVCVSVTIDEVVAVGFYDCLNGPKKKESLFKLSTHTARNKTENRELLKSEKCLPKSSQI